MGTGASTGPSCPSNTDETNVIFANSIIIKIFDNSYYLILVQNVQLFIGSKTSAVERGCCKNLGFRL